MTGHIYKIREGLFGIRIDLPRLQDGRRRQRRYQVRGNRKSAELRLAQLVQELATGTDLDGARSLTSTYLERWLILQSSQLAPSTEQRYRAIVRDFLDPTLGHVCLANLTPLRIQEAILSWERAKRRDRKKGLLSSRTVMHAFSILNAALRQATRWQLLAHNPCDAVRRPRVNKPRVRKLNRAEAMCLLDGFRNHDLFPIVAVALATGLRRGEILALQWSDINLSAGTVTVDRSLYRLPSGELHFKKPKTERSQRCVSLPAFALDVLEQHRRSALDRADVLGIELSPLVFSELTGKPIDPDKLSSAFYYAVRRRSLPLTSFHGLRHSFATLSLAAGVPLKVTSETLGHSNVATTGDIYTEVLNELRRDAAEKFQAFLYPNAL